MNGQMMKSDPGVALKDFDIPEGNIYGEFKPINFNFRKFSRYIKDRNIMPKTVTQETIDNFLLTLQND